MKRRTKVRKQKLNNLLILLVLTATLLVMSTYAWFIANKTVSVNGIDVKIDTTSGLQISADGANWTTVLTSDDLKGAITTYPAAKNQLPALAAPVSSALNVVDSRMEMFYGQVTSPVTDSYVLTSSKQTDQNTVSDGYYVAFDIFLKSGNPEEFFYMSGSAKEQVKESTGTFRDAIPSEIKGIENAARIAIIQGGNTANVENVTEIQNLSTNGSVLLWEPNADSHTKNAIAYASKYLKMTLPAGVSEGTGKPKIPSYDGIKTTFSEINLEDAVVSKHSDKFQNIIPTWQTNKADVINNEMPVISGGKRLLGGVTKYRVYMWIEGQDIDCEDHASGTYLQYNLSFSLEAFTS